MLVHEKQHISCELCFVAPKYLDSVEEAHWRSWTLQAQAHHGWLYGFL